MKVDINFNHSHSNVGLYYIQMLAVLVDTLYNFVIKLVLVCTDFNQMMIVLISFLNTMKVHFGDAAAAQKQIVFVDGKFIFLMLKV